MSIDQRKVVDAIGIERATGDVSLTISDHLDWSDVPGHAFALQEKINDYLAFLESGEIFTEYPAAKGKKMRIQIFFLHAPPAGDALRFLAHAEEVIRKAGFGLVYRVHEEEA